VEVVKNINIAMVKLAKMLLPVALLVILGIDWATGYAIAGYVMHHGVSPNGYAFWQSVGPFCCLLIIQLFRRDVSLAKCGFKYALGCGLFGIAIPNLMIYYVALHLDSGILTILANIAPIFTYSLALLFHQEKFNKFRLLFVIFGVIGVLILVTPIKINLYLGLHNNWLYFSLIIPLCYAFCTVFVSRFKPNTGNVLNYSLWMLLISALVISPITLYSHQFYPLRLDDFNSLLILIEILISALGYVLLFVIIQMKGPVFFTLVNAVAAISGVLYARIVFNQTISVVAYWAILLIIIAILGLGIAHKSLKIKVKH
jgi:drug/metabolite transporter (DMT)-like permease